MATAAAGEKLLSRMPPRSATSGGGDCANESERRIQEEIGLTAGAPTGGRSNLPGMLS